MQSALLIKEASELEGMFSFSFLPAKQLDSLGNAVIRTGTQLLDWNGTSE